MRLKPLQQWICDECGELIKEPRHGYLEWLSGADHKAHGFRIVHHAPRSPRKPEADCYRYARQAGRRDLDLDWFTGTAGIPGLLRFLDVGPYHEPTYRGPEVLDIREWTELFRRLHLPYYEEARLHWEDALRDGFFDEANEVWVYLPETLKKLIEKYGPRQSRARRIPS
jgi:hypothetical protein